MNFVGKKTITLFVLISFLSVAFFSLMMVHGADGYMSGDCPLSVAAGSSLCPINTLDIVAHHISTYRNFFNTPIGFGLTAFILAALTFIYLLSFVDRLHLSTLTFDLRRFAEFVPSTPLHNRQITNWLSLLEHSPSH